MVSQDGLPPILQQAQQALKPYIKQRQEADRIRRVLAAHLSTHVNPQDAYSLSRPLPLVQAVSSLEASSSGIRGIRRDYIRSLKANVKARQEYNQVVEEHQVISIPETQIITSSADTTLDSFLDLVKLRRKHERLRIIQDYVDGLSQKPAAAPDHLDPNVILQTISTQPTVPPEVMNSSGTPQLSAKTDLKELVNRLEQSVLRAKLLLKREQKLLVKLKAEGASPPSISGATGDKLQALGTTRNELINWIESELGKAGESTQDSEDGLGIKSHEHGGRDYIERQLNSVKRQYFEYAKYRQALITAASTTLESTGLDVVQNQVESSPRDNDSVDMSSPSQMVYPFLEELVSISNEQKSIIQQKSHLTTNLSRYLKEANRGLDHLADESHLLPSYPMPPIISLRKATATFGDEISSHEKPDSSRRVKAWVFASDAADLATKDDVLGKLDEGRVAITHAWDVMAELGRLLGDNSEEEQGRDIWAELDGNLGVIKSDD